jgi:hypothetical protein
VTGLTNATPYTFTATATNEGGISVASAPSNSVTPVAAATTATTTDTSKVATVTFLTSYGNNFSMPEQIASGPAELRANSFNDANRVFLGWSVVTNGSATNKIDYTDKAVYAFDSDMQLMARWALVGEVIDIVATLTGPVSASVSFQATPNKDGTPAIKSSYKVTSIMNGFIKGPSWDVPSPGTYAFNLPPATSFKFLVDNTYSNVITTPPASANLKSVTFLGAGAETGQMNALWGSESTALPSNLFLRPGYAFAGWAELPSTMAESLARSAPQPGVLAFADGAVYPFTKSIKLYARWTPITQSSTVSVPGTPPAPTVAAGTAKVTATVAAGTSGGTPASYTVKAYTVNGTEAGTCTVTGSSGFCEVTPLTAGSTYTVKATAKNTAGTSGESGASSPVTVVAPSPTVTAPAAKVPGAPGLTSLSRRSKTEVWVTFSAPSSDGGKPITGYTVTATRNGRDVTQSFPAEAGRVSVGPLTRYAVYTFTVRAVNSVGTSEPSKASRFTVG